MCCMRARCTALIALGLLTVSTRPIAAGSADPGSMLAALGGGESGASLSAGVRKLLLTFLPDPLYQNNKNWDLQKQVEEVKWRGKGFKVHPEKVLVSENDGLWWRVRVTARQPAETLVVDLRD